MLEQSMGQERKPFLKKKWMLHIYDKLYQPGILHIAN